MTIAMEASGEGEKGEIAVAFVLLNRMKTGRWGDNLASVVLAAEQFSCWNTKDPNRQRIAKTKNADPIFITAGAALNKALNGYPDPTGGATHYYSIDMEEAPYWVEKSYFTVQIGKHRFYKGVP